MAIEKRKFQVRAFLASLFFVFAMVIGAIRFRMALTNGGLPTTSIINCSADIFCMILGYVLFICCVIDKAKNEENLNYYLFLLVACVSSAFLDEFAWIVDGKQDLSSANMIINTLYYMGAPTMSYLFWRYVLTYLNIEHKAIKKVNLLLVFGLFASFLMRLINPFFGYYFHIKPDGYYERGNLFLLSNLYPYTATLVTLILVFLARKRLKRFQLATLLLYAFIPLIVGTISVFIYGISLTNPFIMLVLLLMYCVLNVIQSRERTINESELQMANSIQENMLPHTFPPYPHRKEFDLYASMTPAKEVGGDFYDFYMPDDDHLVITIADVSGKGIPAALYMMVTKTLIKNRGLTDFDDCSKMMTTVNNQLCEGNELGMFVTVFLGVLTLSTGELRYSNAGHEYPAIKRKDRSFELIKEKHSPPLGCMEDIPYKEQTMQLNPGDIFYIYTDGVTEANNSKNELFGEDKMIKALDLPCGDKMSGLDNNVRMSIEKFIDGTPQFDDITMLSLKYNGTGIT